MAGYTAYMNEERYERACRSQDGPTYDYADAGDMCPELRKRIERP